MEYILEFQFQMVWWHPLIDKFMNQLISGARGTMYLLVEKLTKFNAIEDEMMSTMSALKKENEDIKIYLIKCSVREKILVFSLLVFMDCVWPLCFEQCICIRKNRNNVEDICFSNFCLEWDCEVLCNDYHCTFDLYCNVV